MADVESGRQAPKRTQARPSPGDGAWFVALDSPKLFNINYPMRMCIWPVAWQGWALVAAWNVLIIGAACMRAAWPTAVLIAIGFAVYFSVVLPRTRQVRRPKRTPRPLDLSG